MSWLNEVLSPLVSAFTGGRQIGRSNNRGFGGTANSRSDTYDQIALPTAQNAEEPEVISQLTASVTDSRDPNAALPVIYTGPVNLFEGSATGRETGLILADASVTGDNDEFLHLTYWITYGPIQGIDIFDDSYGNTNVPIRNETGTLKTFRFDSTNSYYSDIEYDGYGLFFVHDGNPQNQARPNWHNDTSFYPGIAHVKIRLELPDSSVEDPPFTNLPNWRWFVYGINPTQIIDDAVSTAKTRKALYLWDFLTNPIYGRGIASSDIDKASFVHVYNIEQYDNWGSGISGLAPSQAFTHSIQYVPGDSSVGDAVTTMLGEMHCGLVFKRGKFYLRPHPNLLLNSINYFSNFSEYPDIVTFSVTEANTVDGLTFNPVPTDGDVNTVKISAIEHEKFAGTIGDINYYYGQNRNYITDNLDADPRGANVINLQYNGTPSITESNTVVSNSRQATIMFRGTGDLINADPYDLININHRSYPSLKDYFFMVTDTRLNSDMTVEIQAVLMELNRTTAETALRNLFYAEEIFADNSLRKYVYDIPAAPIGEYLQFHNQEIDVYRFNRYRTSYVPGQVVNPTTGDVQEKNKISGLSSAELTGAFDLDREVSPGEYANSMTVRLTATTELPLDDNVYMYMQVAPLSQVNLETNTWPSTTTDFYPNTNPYVFRGQLITNGAGTLAAFPFVFQLQENTAYAARARIWNNNTGQFVDQLNYTFTTTSNDRFADNVLFYQVHTIDGFFSGRNDYSTAIAALGNSLGGTFRMYFYATEGINGTQQGLKEYTFNIPADLQTAKDLPLFLELTAQEIHNLAVNLYTDGIFWNVQMRDSSNTITFDDASTFTGEYLRTANIKLQRQFGYATGNSYNLTLYQRDILERSGNTGLLYD